jgi:pimeloyl-ACP methyl ester carboxylesterase
MNIHSIKLIVPFVALIFFYGCSSSGDSGAGTAPPPSYSVDCSSSATYAPVNDPFVTLSTGAPATVSIIVMHGKTGSPYSDHLLPLYTDLSAAGYDVIAPYMPWSGLDWDGSMCEAMNYIGSLAALEAAKGRDVIVAGHSMGGAHSLIYGAAPPGGEVRGIVTLAPGHFPQLSNLMQTVTAPSIALAEAMVTSGDGDTIASFEILNSGVTVQITASANDYLSFHALDQYPDINDVLPVIELPVLWLAGDVDPITTGYDMAALFTRITSAGSSYQLVTGDHKGMVSNSPAPIVTWLGALGL